MNKTNETEVKCFDVVSGVVNEAAEDFAPLWVIDEEKYDILGEYCEYIDGLADEFKGIAYEVYVDRMEKTVKITLECGDITVESPQHPFNALAERAVRLEFGRSADGNLLVSFVFPSVWNLFFTEQQKPEI